jgi:hypothetical protein
MKKWWNKLVQNAELMRKANGWLTIVWFMAAIPICIFLANSVPFLVFISVYAVVTGHLSTWQSGNVEVNDSLTEGDLENIEKMIRRILSE